MIRLRRQPPPPPSPPPPRICMARSICSRYVMIGIVFLFVCWPLAVVVVECQPATAPFLYDARTTEHDSKEPQSKTQTSIHQNEKDSITRSDDGDYYVGIASHDM